MKTRPTLLAITFMALACLSCHVSAAENIKASNLRCESQTNPLGIDVAKPRLSWIVKSDQRGQKQTTYQVLVASSLPETLASTCAFLESAGICRKLAGRFSDAT